MSEAAVLDSHGHLKLEGQGGVAVVTLANPRRRNAMSRFMWQQLRTIFKTIQASDRWRCVLLRGQDEAFCAGGDIAEYPAFRFDIDALRSFHEDEVWGGLQAVLDCDVPIIAAIDGPCMGAGVEIACCADIRLASENASFGAPIARLGFPMAPREAALVSRVAGEASARQMLLEAAVLSAAEMQARGFLHAVLPATQLMDQAFERAQRMAGLAPLAARMNKQMLRALLTPPEAGKGLLDSLSADAYDYADSVEHREGIAAFLAKRRPNF